MIRRPKVWLVVAALFTLVNLAGAVMAGAQGELLHAGTHVVLFLLGMYVVRRIVRPSGVAIPAGRVPGELDNHLTHLELSIEDVALGVERIGEGQRFITNMFAENDIPATGGKSAATPADDKVPPDAPNRPT